MITDDANRRPALVLGFLGLIPFVGLASAAALGWRPPWIDPTFALLAYGATILSFLGGVQWGFALGWRGEQPCQGVVEALALGVVPQLIGWGALIAGPSFGFWVLAAGLVAHLGLDAAAVRRGRAPAWFMSLRTPLSLGAAASLLAAAVIPS